ncbi:regulator [Streptomyces hygroscopicus subsp. jinggangensis 5008]|nr:regulator [Streptomyces hygroscopicus subsp. jinggangensis 5008]
MGSPKQRGVLALLLAQPGCPVAMHQIVDALWGEDPPASAVNVVQRHISALRRMLEPEMPSRGTSRWLVSGAGGYRLDADPDSLDLLRFRDLRGRAAASLRDGDQGETTDLLLEALALWHGPTASGIPEDVRRHPVFTSVDGEHLATVKEAADLALQATGGDHRARALVPLRQTAVQYPLDEELQARLILMLAATGHQAEALEVYQCVRTQLFNELGVHPGPQLRSAQQRVLGRAFGEAAKPRETPADAAHGRSRTPKAPPSDTPRDTMPSPAQLPPDLASFTGRAEELDVLRALVPDEPASTVVISAIGGMAGVGKTTLAVHWAHQIADRYPDGQLYVDLRGFHPAGSIMSPAEAMRSFLDAFEVPAQRIPAGLEAQAALYRSLLAERRVLIVLDNARDTEHVRPLLPGAPGCLVVVTSRHQLYGLVAGEGAHSVTLDVLSEAEALRFLSHRLGAERVVRETVAAAEIVASCAGLPLALVVVSARAVFNPTLSLASIASELRDSGDSLQAFAGEIPAADARSAFSWSYRLLSPAAARAFRLLALHPGHDCSLTAIASVAGQPPGRVRLLLAELVRAHLVSETAPGRYSCHELLRAYGVELGRSEDAPAELGAARRRLLEHYLHSAHAADSVLAPSRERISLRPGTAGVTVARFDDRAGAADWLDANRSVLLAVIEESAEYDHAEYGWQLAATIESYLDRNGRWVEQLAAQATALSAAQRSGDVRGQAHAHRALGFAHGRLERWTEADEHLDRALILFAQLGDEAGQGRVHRYCAFLANARGLYRKSLEHYERAGTHYRSAGRHSGEASVANEVGWTYILMGDYHRALLECGRSLASHQDLGDRNGEAAAWDSLGCAHLHLGDHDRALDCFGHALQIYRAIKDRYLEADTLVHIGDTHSAAGRSTRAAAAWRTGLEILEEIGHPDAVPVRAKLKSTADSGSAKGCERR